MIHKLRRRFISGTMLAVCLVMVVLFIAINIINYISTDQTLNRLLQLITDNSGTIPSFSETGQDKPDRQAGDGAFSPETPYSTRYFVLYFTEDGELTRADLQHIAAVTAEDAEDYLSIALTSSGSYGYTGNYKYYIAAAGESQYMAVFLDCQQELHALRVFALDSALVIIVCLGLIYLLVLFFSRRAVQPILNNMEKQKQFITDASHELKTPLTVITTSLKVLEMEVGQQKWIDKAQAQAERMGELINNLITLSRLDEQTSSIPFASFNISEAVMETAESFRDFALARGHELILNIPADLTYNGNEYAVRQLISILIDNAVKYASADTPISFSLEKARRGVLLRAHNFCSSISVEDAAQLFDRFYRVDKSRSRQAGGFGIGLSIARSIAESHRGTIQAEIPADGEIAFVVTLK